MARVQIRLAADERTVARTTAWISRFCERSQLSRAVTDALCLSLEEIVSNIVTHGYERQPGKMSIALDYDRRTFSVVIEDEGKLFDPTQAEAPSLEGTLATRREGGLGLLLVKTLMDDVAYQRVGAINRLKLAKRL
jgi:serine/threonine-protein kinase RsbW